MAGGSLSNKGLRRPRRQASLLSRSSPMPVYRLPDTGAAFPDPMLAEPDGLLAVGGDLSPARIIAAYASGIFPWYSEDSPILWWSPDPRCILLPEQLHVPRSLRRVINAGAFRFTMDTAFESVIAGCAASRGDGMGTWLVPEMREAYTALFHLGLVHSVEAWQDGELAGGLYGLSLGSAFFGESMFYTRPEASKAALVHLVRCLRQCGFTLVDCQQETAHLLRFGARGVPRREYLDRLDAALTVPTVQGSWEAGPPVCPACSRVPEPSVAANVLNPIDQK